MHAAEAANYALIATILLLAAHVVQFLIEKKPKTRTEGSKTNKPVPAGRRARAHRLRVRDRHVPTTRKET